jgi:uncharacterized protein
MLNLWQILGLGLFALALCRLLLAGRAWWRAQRRQAASLAAERQLLERQMTHAVDPAAVPAGLAMAWQGFRGFRVRRKVAENGDICSFYLEPQDARPLPSFKPGQYLTFQLLVAGQKRPVVRCYSLSDAPRRDYFRVSIKRLPAPADKPEAQPGLGSNHFHDHIKEGDLVSVKAPNGDFYCDLAGTAPVVLLGGGIGLTPVLCMANALMEQGGQREAWLFYGLRGMADLAFIEQLKRLASQPRFRVCLAFSKAPANDAVWQALAATGILLETYLAGPRQPPGKLILVAGERVGVPLLQKLLPGPLPYHYYMCGPGPMMASLSEDLPAWGVPLTAIHQEAFGPSSTRKKAPTSGPAAAPAPSVSWRIEFAQSHQTLAWDASLDNLLDLAREHGIPLDSGCRIGNCGTCLVGLKSGRVRYAAAPNAAISPDSCLTCVAVPESDLVIDA